MEPPRPDDQSTLISRAVEIDTPAFRAAYRALPKRRTVWDSPGGPLTLGGGAAATVTASGTDRFNSVRTAAESLFDSSDVHAATEAAAPRLFGGFAFHEVAEEGGLWDRFPDAEFILPDMQLTYTDDTVWLTVNATGSAATVSDVEDRLAVERDRLSGLTGEAASSRPGIESISRTTDRDAWRETVSEATTRIESGELNKVVLAQALEARLEANLDPAATLERLRARYPGCYVFCIDPDGGDPVFFGATPEQLVSVRGRTVKTTALAGTTGRGETPAEDEWLADELQNDPKNRHEHELVADAIQRQLQPYAASISTGPLEVRRLATVQHLQTPITVELETDEHVLTLAEALHPTPAVGGLPPDVALRTIRDTEPFDRGWYAAPVGWIDAAGNGTFGVALRSAVASCRQARLFAGVGIVTDSDPDREWDEIELKYQPILDTLESDTVK
jgi:isochorismate synthases